MLGLREDPFASCMLLQIEQGSKHLRNCSRLVSQFVVKPEHRRQGRGRGFMKALCLDADANGLVLLLEPRATEDGALSTELLESWYQRFGFKRFQDAPVALMARMPRR